ncbi:hypothetical protein RJ641_008137 [Dillenia turbinata]|uniref:Uncharacterized protein n=1 Tax=Dillenia turbinata TaxID=194707 RepID=A0AAN8ZAH3_9MAGN
MIMKRKEVAIENSNINSGEKEEQLYDDPAGGDGDVAAVPWRTFSSRNAFSKYDFVKVKVWPCDNADHYYVLSRFLLSRMLTVTKIPNHVAIKIAVELQKLLIDNTLSDVYGHFSFFISSLSDLEANLFKLMERRGYGEDYINCYEMMARFHHQRVPLVILVCGTACVGKSTIATQLAQRQNLPNVLQGIHLDPSIYLMDDENKLPKNVPTEVEEAPEVAASDDKSAVKREDDSKSIAGWHSENSSVCPEKETSACVLTSNEVNEVLNCLESVDLERSASQMKDVRMFGLEYSLLTMALIAFKHRHCWREWIVACKFSGKCLIEEKDNWINNLKTIQNYLCSFKGQGLTVANIIATTFPQTLDCLRSYLLQVLPYATAL